MVTGKNHHKKSKEITSEGGEGDYTGQYLSKLEELSGKGPYTKEDLEDERISEYLSECYEEDARTEGGIIVTLFVY